MLYDKHPSGKHLIFDFLLLSVFVLTRTKNSNLRFIRFKGR